MTLFPAILILCASVFMTHIPVRRSILHIHTCLFLAFFTWTNSFRVVALFLRSEWLFHLALSRAGFPGAFFVC